MTVCSPDLNSTKVYSHGHSGVKSTLTEVHSKYWFVRGRQFVRKLLFQCVTCCKLEGPHYRAVPPPPLPEYRVKEAPPFAYSGVDFAGPLHIKVPDGSDSSKVWVALYTCCIPLGTSSRHDGPIISTVLNILLPEEVYPFRWYQITGRPL